MSRYRPPVKRGSRYITVEGARRLRDEFDELWRRKRPDVVKALAAAAAEGDRSENAEYIYRKKQLREIDRRVRYLGKRLDELIVVDRRPDDEAGVYFGAWVRLADQFGQALRYRIVGPDEFDPARGWISLDSPVARALLKRRTGDEVDVDLPAGRVRLEITGVSYDPPPCGSTRPGENKQE